jgi:hypothetical protein
MLVLKDTQKSALAIQVLSLKGNPAPIDGVPVWAVSDPALLSLADVSADGLSATVNAVGPVGTGQVSVNVDADLGEGIVPVIGVLDVQVVGGDAAVVQISSGPAEEQV